MQSAPNAGLGDNIALIAIAVVLGVEAWKAKDRLPRIILTVLAVAFGLSGLFLAKLAATMPALGAFVAGMFDDPSSWLILGIALFLVARPLWADRGATPPSEGVEEQMIYTFWQRSGASLTQIGRHVIAGLVIAPRETLTNVRVYLSHADMAGHSPLPPGWGELSNRQLLHKDNVIQAGDRREIKLFERDWSNIKNEVYLAGHTFGQPDDTHWPFKKLRIDLISDQRSVRRDLALFMPGYSIVMLVDASSVEMSGDTFAGPVTLNDPRLRND